MRQYSVQYRAGDERGTWNFGDDRRRAMGAMIRYVREGAEARMVGVQALQDDAGRTLGFSCFEVVEGAAYVAMIDAAERAANPPNTGAT